MKNWLDLDRKLLPVPVIHTPLSPSASITIPNPSRPDYRKIDLANMGTDVRNAKNIVYTFVRDRSSAELSPGWLATEAPLSEVSIYGVKTKSIFFAANSAILKAKWLRQNTQIFTDGVLVDTQINAIDFSSNNLAEYALELLVTLRRSEIVEINLSNNSINNPLTVIIDRIKNTYINILDLSYNNISIIEAMKVSNNCFMNLSLIILSNLTALNLTGNPTDQHSDLGLLNNIWDSWIRDRWDGDVEIYKLGLIHTKYCQEHLRRDISILIKRHFLDAGKDGTALLFPPHLEQLIIDYAIIETTWDECDASQVPLIELD